jgi:hypothetical protein
MSAGLGEQIESLRTFELLRRESDTPWREVSQSCRYRKVVKLRRERRRAKHNPECPPQYRRYRGYEF